jgi:hypothetical protein
MGAAVRLLFAALPFIKMLLAWLERRRLRKEAEVMAKAALKEEEARAAERIDKVMAEQRTDDDAARRLRDGTA